MLTMPRPSVKVAAKTASGTGARKAAKSAAVTSPEAGEVVDLDRYVPAYFTWIANKLSSGASQAYLATCDVGIETWRLLVLLALGKPLSAQGICRVIGMDKASVSRAFKSMQARALITIALDDSDGRLRVATITAKGRALHDEILAIALDREEALLSVLTKQERETLIALIRRLHENLPAVEASTARYLARHYPHVRTRRNSSAQEE